MPRPKKSASLYCEPVLGLTLDQCYFYHTLDLPCGDAVPGDWDLDVATYMAGVYNDGERVLDIGCASGALSFWCEDEGAEVVSFDLGPDGHMDYAPSRSKNHASTHSPYMQAVNNSYWYAHERLGSHNRVVHGTVYDIPEAIGPVDTVIYGAILLHLRDAFAALRQGLRLATKRAVVAESFFYDVQDSMRFVPNYQSEEPQSTWWHYSPSIIQRMCAALGFEDSAVTYHSQQYRGKPQPMFTVVANRTWEGPDPFGS